MSGSGLGRPRPRSSGIVVLLVLVAVGMAGCDDPDPEPGPSTTTASTAPTAPTTSPTTMPVTLPVDTRLHAEAVSATADFAGVAAQASFDGLVREVVAVVEQRHPGEAGSSLRTDSASGSTATTGTVLVRRHGFADDSVAGYEYTVSVEQGAGGWRVASATKAAICYRGVSGSLCV